MTNPAYDSEDGHQIIDRAQTYRIFGAHLVNREMSIIAFGPWSGEYGCQFDFLEAITKHCDRTGAHVDTPLLGIPAEMPPVEEPSLFWACLIAVPKGQIPLWRLRRMIRSLHMHCMEIEKGPLKEGATQWARIAGARTVFPAKIGMRLTARNEHAKRCLTTMVEVLDNVCAVGKEFQEPEQGKEV